MLAKKKAAKKAKREIPKKVAKARCRRGQKRNPKEGRESEVPKRPKGKSRRVSQKRDAKEAKKKKRQSCLAQRAKVAGAVAKGGQKKNLKESRESEGQSRQERKEKVPSSKGESCRSICQRRPKEKSQRGPCVCLLGTSRTRGTGILRPKAMSRRRCACFIAVPATIGI